ncbi:MAG: FecR domain-containing protein [Pseudomonadales bacterium]
MAVQELSIANNLKNARHTLCVAGMLILVASPFAAVAEDWLHTVRPGDTYWSLCLELTNQAGCWQTLPDYNPQVTNPRALPQGSQIKIPVEWLKAPPVPASVEIVRGDALLLRNNKSGKRIQPGSTLNEGDNYLQTAPGTAEEIELRAGVQLYMGDKIITREGNVLLRFADNSSFLVKANSELLLERLSAHGQTGMVDTHMRLNYGSGRAKVNSRNGKSRYRISTPAAIAAARGTDFSISANTDESGEGNSLLRNEVLEGEVAISSTEGSQAVKQGFGTVAKQGEAPLAPVKLLPAANLDLNTSTELPFTLQWSAVDGAEAYTVDVFSGEPKAELLQAFRTENTETRFDGLMAGNYTFVVRAIDTLGLRGLEASASTEATVLLATPNLPKENIILDGGSVHIDWPAIEGATAYRTQFSTDSDFASVLEEVESSETAVDVELPEGTKYYVRVQAVYPHYGASEFSAIHSFSSKTRDLWLIILQALGILAIVI